MTTPLDRHWGWNSRTWAAAEAERDAIIANELREVADELDAGTIHARGSIEWTDNARERGRLALRFRRVWERYG